MSAPTNESYEIKRVQLSVAASISPLMHQLGGKVGYYLNPTDPGVTRPHVDAMRWRKDKQIIDFFYSHHDGRKSEGILFSNAFYSPESDFTEGTPQLLQNVNLRVDEKSKIFDNSKGKDPIHIAYSESETLENSVENHIGQSFTFDTTVTSETTVSGGYGGVDLETKLTAEVHAGFAKETAKDTAESKSDEEEIGIEFDCPARTIKLLEVMKDHKRELIPTKGKFILDFMIQMNFYHWWQKAPGVKWRPKTNQISVNSVEGLLQFAQGVDTDYPTMEGFWNDRTTPESLRSSVESIMEPAHRMYQLDIDKMRILESNVTYKVTDLDTPDGHDLEVVDLSDEENRDRYTQ